MRKFLSLMLCLLLLTGCTAHDPLAPVAGLPLPGGSAIPEPIADAALTAQQGATLWFRLVGEPLLAPAHHTLATSPTEPYEQTLLTALIKGPDGSRAELAGLFPSGTRCLNTHRQGRQLFVTLSRQIMNDYPDERRISADEARLRRRLAMQSIAATVTENCDVDEIIILVEQGTQVTDSLRLRRSYYRAGGDGNALAAPLLREESLLLTHGTAMNAILQAWSERDFARLYRYTSRHDPLTGQARPEESTFARLMERLPHLARYEALGGSISTDGQWATFSVDATVLIDGREVSLRGLTFRLHREHGLWRIALPQLTDRWEVAP